MLSLPEMQLRPNAPFQYASPLMTQNASLPPIDGLVCVLLSELVKLWSVKDGISTNPGHKQKLMCT